MEMQKTTDNWKRKHFSKIIRFVMKQQKMKKNGTKYGSKDYFSKRNQSFTGYVLSDIVS
jgi:hypothetical protein